MPRVTACTRLRTRTNDRDRLRGRKGRALLPPPQDSTHMHTSTKMRRAASRVLEPLTAAARISTNGAARRKQSDDRDVASKRKASRATHTRRLPPTARHRKRSPGVKVGATRPGSPQGRRPRRTGSPRLDRRSGWPKAPSPRRPLPEKTGASREVEHPGASKGCLHPLPGRSLLSNL